MWMYPYLSSTAISENSRNDRNSFLSVRLSPISLHDDGGFIFTLRFSKARWWVKENNLYEIVGQVTYAWLRTANHNPCIECRSLLVSSHMHEFHYKMFCYGWYNIDGTQELRDLHHVNKTIRIVCAMGCAFSLNFTLDWRITVFSENFDACCFVYDALQSVNHQQHSHIRDHSI